MKKNRLRRFFTLVLAAALCAGPVTAPAEAAVKKVKQQDLMFTYKKSVAKKATTVKTGTNTLQIKKSGYVKFKVPKTKKYTITYTGMTMVKGFTSNGHSYIQLPVTQYGSTRMQNQEVSTQGGKTSTIRYAVAKYASSDKTNPSASLATRTCKLKLKKGSTVYIYFYLGGGTDDAARLKLKIK